MADVELNSIGNGDGTNYLVRDNTKIPLSGSNQISGSLIPATTDSVNLGSSVKEYLNAYIKSLTINGVACGDILTHNESEFVPRSGGAVLSGTEYLRTVDNSKLILGGGTSGTNGGSVAFFGKDHASLAGFVSLKAQDSNKYSQLIMQPSGTFQFTDGVTTKNVAMQEDTVPRSGGAVLTGRDLGRIDDAWSLNLYGGSTENNGGFIILYGASHSWTGGRGLVRLCPSFSSDSKKQMNLFPSGSWDWNGQAIQLVSDQRYKQQITQIDDDLLDAWEDVELCQFKYNDAVKEKSDNARLHTGYVVQQINKACNEHGVDVSKYGLYCHEEYAEETREVEHEDGTKTTEVVRPASEHYSLRYTEALIVECAYLRKKNKDLQEQLNALSERLEKLENR